MTTDHIDIEQVFFTIVIPTRERADTLIHTLATALSQDYENFEVLVSDNASCDETREKILAIKNPRLRYINTGKRVSMSKNWEFAINHVERGWITVLGDDDGILPGSLKIANKIIKETGTSAIRSNGGSYSWPGLTGDSYGRLSVSLRRGYEIRDSGQMLQRVIDGQIPYNELPMLYNGGFISIELINKAKKINANFFQSMTPDVYSSIALSFITEKYVYCHEPLALNGASIHSLGTAGFEKSKKPRSYDPAEKFWEEKNIPFHEDLPLARSGRAVRSISICVYESYLQAEKFHHLKSIQTSHVQQLRIALEKSGPDKNEIKEWTNDFAIKHNIKLSDQIAFRRSKYFRTIKSIYKRIIDGLDSYVLYGSLRIQIKNIHEASLITGMLKELRPTIIKKVVQRFKNKYSRALYD